MVSFVNKLPFAFLFLFFACGSEDDGTTTPSDTLPQLTVSGVSKFEGNEATTDFDFKVRLSKAADAVVSVDFETANGSAVAGEDFIENSGQLTFEPGSIEEIITVQVVTDTLKEGDEEFEMRISNPSNAVVTGAAGTGTIRNDDTFLAGGEDGYITPTSYAGYDLVWADEFDGPSIDENNWKHEMGNHGWGNSELQNYTASPENSYISDGKLIIEAIKESSGGSQYSSARMISAGMQEFKYGRIDIRAKLPEGQGIWPALWMLGGDFWSNGWPACGEIDIMEIIGSEPSTLHGTIHWDNNGTKADFGGSTTLSSGKFSDEYHVFTIIWDEQEIKWLLDDQQYHSADISPGALNEFKQPFFFIFNIAVGGNWPGSPDASTVFPQRMFVDYIRVFQE